MKRYLVTTMLASLALGLAALFMLSGCEEKDVPVLVDEDEIVKYLGSVGIAKELFRTTGLFNSTPYTVPFDSAVMTDRVLKRSRTMDVSLVPLKIAGAGGDSVDNDPDIIYADHGYLGKVRESVVRVDDQFTIETKFAYANDTVFDTGTVLLTRYAFFLKLGADTRDYLGWVLWGFNGVEGMSPSVSLTLKTPTGAEFRGDQAMYDEVPLSRSGAIPKVPYIRLTAMDTVLAGSRLLVTSTKGSGVTPVNHLLSDYSQEGAFTRLMHRYMGETDYLDSLSYQTPTTNPRTYNQLVIQSVSETGFPNRTAFVVPYRK